jgi:hypothetical protein
MAEPTLHPATIADIPTIAALASQIWQQHYVPMIGQKQVDYMLKAMYSTESLTNQMLEKNHLFYLVMVAGEALGFISVNQESAGNWFLNKFYILSDKAAKGLGTRVFKRFLALHAPKQVKLTVNRQNYKSINFYFKNGFIIREVADFDIGEGYQMNDFVMVWKA